MSIITEFGISLNKNLTEVTDRVLDAPPVLYGKSKELNTFLSIESHILICECKMNVPYYGFIIFIWSMQLVNLIVNISELVTLASLASSFTRRQKLLWKALVMLLSARTEENVKRLVTGVSSSFRKWFYYYSLIGLEFEDGRYKLNCLQLMAAEYLENHLKLSSQLVLSKKAKW